MCLTAYEVKPKRSLRFAIQSYGPIFDDLRPNSCYILRSHSLALQCSKCAPSLRIEGVTAEIEGPILMVSEKKMPHPTPTQCGLHL